MRTYKTAFVAFLTLTLSLSAQVQLSEISASPEGPYSLSVGYGQSTSLDLTLGNSNSTESADLNAFFLGEASSGLDGVLSALNTDVDSLLSIIPDRYLFSHGVTGTYISDGGGDMYDSGNYLRFDTNSALNYSDDTRSSAEGVDYFTRKYDGLFVLGADYGDSSEFHISGGLGADGGGSVSLREFDVGYGYHAYVKVVHGAGDPSVNHLILVPNTAGLARTAATSTDSDAHSVTGLPSDGRLYYLLFAESSGLTFSDVDVESLANDFLSLVKPGPSWFTFPEATLPALSYQNSQITLDASGLDTGVYSTDFVISPNHLSPESTPTESFRELSLTVGAASFTTNTESIEIASVPGFTPGAQMITLQPESAGLLSGLGATSSQPWAIPAAVTGQNSIQVSFNFSGLSIGTHQAAIFITSGTTTQRVDITAVVNTADIVKLLPDPMRPRLYAINQDEENRGSLQIINTLNQEIIEIIPLGNEPSDMALTEDSDELLVINTSDPSIQRIDLENLEVTETYQLTEFSNRNDDFGAHVADGPGDIIYYVDEQWGPRLRVFDTSTEMVLQTLSSTSNTSPDTSNNYGYGDIVVSPNQSRLYGWSQYGDGAGVGNTSIIRFDISGDGLLNSYAITDTTYSETNFRREPFNTPVMMTADGSNLIIKDRSIDQENLDNFLNIYPDEIISISPGAEVVSGANAIYSGNDAEVLYNFPLNTQVQAILPDYSRLVYFNTADSELTWLDLEANIGADDMGLGQKPLNGSTVFPPDELSWLPTQGYGNYDVYLGTNQSAVASATTTSTEYQGTATQPSMLLQDNLLMGITYYWRVDGRSASGTQTGTIKSFTVANIDTQVDQISHSIPQGAPFHELQFVPFNGTPNTNWSATTTSPWIVIQTTSGATQDNLEFRLNTHNLLPGEYSGTVQISLDGGTLIAHEIEIDIEVSELDIVKFLPDPMRPRLYAISQDEDESAHLIVFNTLTQQITHSIFLGNEPTDMDLTENSDALLVINTSDPSIQKIDLDRLEITDTYQLTEFSGYNNDYGAHVADGPGSIIYYIDEESGPRLRVYDTATQSVLQTFSSSDGTTPSTNSYGYGDIVVSPDRSRLYGWSQYGNTSSSLTLVRFDIANDGQLDGFIKTESSYSENNFRRSPFNTPPMMTADGSELILKDRSIDLEDLDLFPNLYLDEIYSISPFAEIVAGANAIYSGNDSEVLYNFPLNAPVQTILPDYSHLVYFNTTSHQLTWLNLSANVGSDDLGLSQQPENGATVFSPNQLSWLPIAGYGSYDVYIGADADAVVSATTTASEYAGVTMGPYFKWTSPLELGTTYYWRVDGRGASGSLLGSVQSFTLPDIDADIHEFSLDTPEGAPTPDQEVQFSGTAGINWSASTSSAWLEILTPSGTTETNLRFRVRTESLAPGDYSGEILVIVGGQTISIPVELNIQPLNILKLESMPGASHAYALSATPPLDGPSFLLEIDPASTAITRYLECGRKVVDFAISREVDQAFVIADAGDEVVQLNLSEWLSAGSIDVSSLSSSSPERILAAPDGNFILGDSYNLYSVDAETGEALSLQSPMPYGYTRGWFSEDDSILYVASSSRIAQVSYNTGAFSDFIQGDATSNIYNTARVLGSTSADQIFAGKRSYNSDLKINWYYDEIILATDSLGKVCLGESALYWSESGKIINNFTIASTITTISGDNQYLLRYINTDGSLESIPLADYLTLPGPNVQPGEILYSAPAQLSVPPIEGVNGYRFYIGQSPDDLSYLGVSTEPMIDLNTVLSNHSTYYWRVDSVNGRGITTNTGAVYDFLILPEAVDTEIGGVKTSVNLQNRELLTGSSNYPNYSATINSMNPNTGVISDSIGYSRIGNGYSSSNPFGKDVVKAGDNYYTLDETGIYSVSVDDRGFLLKNDVYALPDDAIPASLTAYGDMLFVSTKVSNYPTYNYTLYVYRTFPELILEATIEVPENSDGSTISYFGMHFSAHGDHLAVRGYLYNSTTSPRIQTEVIFIYQRDHNNSTWAHVDTELLANTSPSYSSQYYSMSSDDGLIVAASNYSGNPQVSILREQADGSFNVEAFIDSTEFPDLTSSYIQVDVDQNHIAVALRSANVGPVNGAIFVLQHEDSTWRVKEPLTSLTATSFAYDVSLADGWLATMANEQVLLYDIGAENTRPLITSPRPFQLVYERDFEMPLSYDDTADDTVEMSLSPDLDWISIQDTSTGYVLTGSAPSELPDTVTLRITATDQSGATDSQTFDLALLSSSDVPVVTDISPSDTLGVGQDLTLRADISGSGPFTWQWYKNGNPIPGATQNSFSITFLNMEDADSYTASITNAVGTTETTEIAIEVRPANRFAGDWPMFGGGAKHLGFHPATLDTTHLFVEEWSESISSNYIHRAVIAEGKVFATPYVRFNGPCFAYCYDLETGEAQWTHEFPEASSLNPPAYHDGRIYIQRVKGTDDRTTQLWSLDSQTGETVWSAPFSAQWESYESPTVTDDGVWINGGYSGGMYGFDLDGTQRFFESLAQYDDWTPTYSNGHLYSWVAGVFTEHNPGSGEDLWYVNTGWDWSGWSMNTVATVTESEALLISTTELICIDINERDVRWRVEKRYQGSPAVNREHVYAIYQNQVETYDLETGAPGLIYETADSENLYSAQPLLLNDHLIVATTNNTYVFALGNTTPIQTLPKGGRLSYAEGYLMIAGSTGELTAYFANDVPDFIANLPDITADAAGSDESLDISQSVYDADEDDQLKYAIVENTNPDIFSNITIGATDGQLNIRFAPYVSGVSDVTIRVSDPDNTYSEYTIAVTLPSIPDLEISTGPVAMNRQTGLYEQTLTVKNVGGRAVGGFEIQLDGLEGDFKLMGYDDGPIGYYQPVGAGESVALTLQYYSPTSSITPDPSFELSQSLVPQDPDEALTLGIPVDRILVMKDQSVLIEFPSIPGHTYAIQYSYDMDIWYQSPHLSLAGANRTQWFDDGMPKTDQHPSQVPSKFYRVLDITDNAR